MNIQLEKAGENIKKNLGPILQQDFGPTLGLVSINRVSIAPDFRTCRVTVSVFSKDISPDEAIDELNANQGQVQRKLAEKIDLKFTPRIQFVYDDTIEAAGRIEEVLKDN